jgi:hypothetical protein
LKDNLYVTPPRQNFNQISRNPNDIPIVQAVYGAYAFWNEVLLKFPKIQRHFLGQTCSAYLLEILEKILASAQTIHISEKMTPLRQASAKLDTLKLLIRLAKDCKCISNTQYLHMESKLQEIGRMIGGWIKSLG